MADAAGLKPADLLSCGFESHYPHSNNIDKLSTFSTFRTLFFSIVDIYATHQIIASVRPHKHCVLKVLKVEKNIVDFAFFLCYTQGGVP